MSEIPITIILSSGTVVQIPAFSELTEGPRNTFTRQTRGGAILAHYVGGSAGHVHYMKYDMADMIELGNILTNSNETSLIMDTPDVSSQHCAFLYWYPDPTNNCWSLAISFRYYRGLHLDWANMQPENGNNFFNDRNPNNTMTPPFYQSFDETVEHAITSYSDAFFNAKSGITYALEVATNGCIFNFANHRTDTQIAENIAAWMTDHPDWGGTIVAYDPETNDDPYIVDDPSSFGGGDGSREDPDDIEKATIPPLPSVSAVDTGLITMYGATLAQLQALGAYLWSDLWDIETNFKKLFADPMNCLIGLSIVPVRPTMGGGQNVKFGNITTNVALNKLSSQWAEVDCGSVSIKEYIGSFLDYSPYVNISIYLPYIGYRELSPDDVMNDSIHVVYHIDCLTGGCCAFVETGKKGLLYTFNGSCIANVPITAINYSGAIQNAVSAVGSMAMTGVGIATGAAPVAAMGVASGLSNAANTAVNSKPTVQRSGNMGGSAGLMSYQKPMLVITRPRMSVPAKLNKFTGLTTNVTMPLSSIKGFTQIELIHLDGIPCTDDERSELLSLLKQGVIF